MPCTTYLFAGSDSGGAHPAAMYTLTENTKMNGLNPEAYLRDCPRHHRSPAHSRSLSDQGVRCCGDILESIVDTEASNLFGQSDA
jgi:hypothetical protein